MQVCLNCTHENREGVLFCEACGVMLGTLSAAETAKLDTGDVPTTLNWGTATFGAGTAIIFHVANFSKPIIFRQPVDTIALGRTDRDGGSVPDLDLTPYGALEKGVSRLHARIERVDNNIMLADLGSRNATFLNGQRVSSTQPRLLRDGDEIRLGGLAIRIYFRTPEG